MEIKKKLSTKERQRLEELLTKAKEMGENSIAQIAKLALDLSDQGRYDQFQELFSEND